MVNFGDGVVELLQIVEFGGEGDVVYWKFGGGE